MIVNIMKMFSESSVSFSKWCCWSLIVSTCAHCKDKGVVILGACILAATGGEQPAQQEVLSGV
jgi:hypothetical protein